MSVCFSEIKMNEWMNEWIDDCHTLLCCCRCRAVAGQLIVWRNGRHHLAEAALPLWRNPEWLGKPETGNIYMKLTVTSGGQKVFLARHTRLQFVHYLSVFPAVLKFLKLQSCPEIVLKSQSFCTNVLILTIVVRAQWQFNVLLAALLICLLNMWIQF